MPNTLKTVDISGMGGGYEDCCQKMLWNGIRHIEEHKPTDLVFEEYKNITGVCIPRSASAEALEKAVMAGVADATGGMHHAVMGHLTHIAKHGRDAWLGVFTKDSSDPDRVYEIDAETLAPVGGPRALPPELEGKV